MKRKTLAQVRKENTPPAEKPAEGYKWVKVLVGGAWIQIKKDTSLCCDPSSDTYWSM
jgi:hypothetical protein